MNAYVMRHTPMSFWYLTAAAVIIAESSFMYLALQPNTTTYQRTVSAHTNSVSTIDTNQNGIAPKILSSKVYKPIPQPTPEPTPTPTDAAIVPLTTPEGCAPFNTYCSDRAITAPGSPTQSSTAISSPAPTPFQSL